MVGDGLQIRASPLGRRRRYPTKPTYPAARVRSARRVWPLGGVGRLTEGGRRDRRLK